MKSDDDGDQEPRRVTAVEPAFEIVVRRRAEDLGMDFGALLKEQSSKPTASRVEHVGMTAKLLRKVEDALDAEELRRDVKVSRSQLLRDWLAVGAEILVLDDGVQVLRRMLDYARDGLRRTKALEESLARWRSGDGEENGAKKP